MSKQNWKKHEQVKETILKILRPGKIMTANVILFELRQRDFKISYGSVARRLIELKEEGKIKSIESLHSNQKIWTTHHFLKGESGVKSQ